MEYGMVIVDECHHVPAANFELLMKSVRARYVYGLTATPVRKDGRQPIIFMQCGPIRFSADAKAQMVTQSFERLLVPRFTSYRDLAGEAASYSQIIQSISQDITRNNLIVRDVKLALEDGRTPFVLSNLTSHVKFLADWISKFCDNVITLVGSESNKEKRLELARLQSIPPGAPMVVVATGKYIGEGFDYPRLDTLFLALPVSWKGIVAQYAGRLHRECPGKKDVRIYDYIDIHVPLCDTMYKRRLNGYSAIGYRLMSDSVIEDPQSQNIIFSKKTYIQQFLNDIASAAHSVIITAGRVTLKPKSKTMTLLSEAAARRVEVILFVKTDSAANDILTGSGIQVRIKEDLSIRAAVVDKADVWYGNLNYLGYTTDEDHAIRISSPDLADEIIGMLY